MDYTHSNFDEKALLKEIKSKTPQEFVTPTIIEDNDFLSRFGIYIKGKEKFVGAYIKLYPEDFIVEELLPNGDVCTINPAHHTEKYIKANCFEATLVKRGLRTTEAISEIAKQLKCKESQIKYYGLKDEDAVTSQKISFSEIDYTDISSIKSDKFFIKDIASAKMPLIMGNNKGNRFTMIIRTASNIPEHNLPALGVNQFYNYFYTQRFLPPRFANFYWAILILQGNYKEALKEFLCFVSPFEQQFFAQKRQLAEKVFGSWDKMRDIFTNYPTYFNREIKVLDYLIDHPSNIPEALNMIPEQIRLWMYTLSSWFFNHQIASLVKEGANIPPTLPMFISRSPDDWKTYEGFALDACVYPPNLKNLRHFPSLNPQRNKVKTIAQAFVHKIEQHKDYIKIVFDLDTGSYATTFLSHFFNLVSGDMPEEFSKETFTDQNIF